MLFLGFVLKHFGVMEEHCFGMHFFWRLQKIMIIKITKLISKNNLLFRGFATDKKDYYKILELAPTSSFKQIRQRYLKKAKQHHPDKTNQKQSQKYHEIQQAYKNLNNPKKRKLVDINLGISFSQWERDVETVSEEFQQAAFQDILKPSASVHKTELDSIEDKLKRKHKKKIEEMSFKDFVKDPIIITTCTGFILLWMLWTFIQLFITNHKGDITHHQKQQKAQRSMKIIPLNFR